MRQVIYAWNYLEWGGAQIYLLAIMKAAEEHFDILVILPKDSSAEMIRFLDDTGVHYEFSERHLDLSPALGPLQKIKRQLRRMRVEFDTYRRLLRFDVKTTAFHIEIAPWQSVTFLTAMSLRGAKVFLTLHNALPNASKWRELLWKARLRFVSILPGLHFFASNADTKNKLKGWVTKEFWNNIKVTYTAVDPNEIETASTATVDLDLLRGRFGISKGAFVVLCVGQFIDRKGRWTFLEAAKKIKTIDPTINFVWLTPKAPDQNDKQRIDSFDLNGRFHLVLSETVGNTRQDVLTFFRLADIFALPSFVEGLPIALLEAMALRLPSVSTNVYAIPEAIIPGETGILIEAGDSDALAENILALKSDPVMRLRLSEQGSDHVLNSFTERKSALTAIAAYEAAFENGN
jgi:glycosyltransferase involved in cell wall biosynthesis